MNFTEDEIKEYVEKTKKFYEECYAIFLITVHEDDPGSVVFVSFNIYPDTSIFYFTDFEGDLCEYTFPTEWLNKDSDYIAKEHKKRNELYN